MSDSTPSSAGRPASERPLAEVRRTIWGELAAAKSDRHHPFHVPAVATAGPDGPQVRSVVLRRVDPGERRLVFHTDARSPKVATLTSHPEIEWLFYDASRNLQVRARGRAFVHREGTRANEAWERAALWSRRCYLQTAAPGDESEHPTSGLPEELADRAPSELESRAGRPNFAIVETEVTRFDWLKLASSGHRRAVFLWSGERWGERWVMP